MSIYHAPIVAVERVDGAQLTLACGHVVHHDHGTVKAAIRCPYCPPVPATRLSVVRPLEESEMGIMRKVKPLPAYNDSPDRTGDKVCVKCGQVKPRTEFYKLKSTTDGLTTKCRDCYNASRRTRL